MSAIVFDVEFVRNWTHPGPAFPRTINGMEGGIYSRIDELIVRHR